MGMKLSVQIEGAQGLTWTLWKTMVALVDSTEFAGLYCCDHFANPGPFDFDSLEVMTAMTYAASHSRQLILGTLVAPITWRDPVMLARQAMAIDDLSGERFVLGIGAGWNEREHGMFGYPLGDLPTRFARLGEALEVITHLIRHDEPQTFTGAFYRLHTATLRPRPRRQTPVLVGGSGLRRTLPLVARYADIWNTGIMTVHDIRKRNKHLDALILKEGRAPADVKRTMMAAVICGRSDAAYEARLRGWRRNPANAQTPRDSLLDSLRPSCLVGTPEEVATQMRSYANAGIEEIMVQFVVPDDFDGVRMLAEEVLPLVIHE